MGTPNPHTHINICTQIHTYTHTRTHTHTHTHARTYTHTHTHARTRTHIPHTKPPASPSLPPSLPPLAPPTLSRLTPPPLPASPPDLLKLAGRRPHEREARRVAGPGRLQTPGRGVQGVCRVDRGRILTARASPSILLATSLARVRSSGAPSAGHQAALAAASPDSLSLSSTRCRQRVATGNDDQRGSCTARRASSLRGVPAPQ